jgi:hypothetical protein
MEKIINIKLKEKLEAGGWLSIIKTAWLQGSQILCN